MDKLWAVIALLSLAACSSDGPATSPARLRPNVLIVTIDTLRADALSSYGANQPTPALDQLAKDGIRFERAITPAPLTLPAHASLFTGTLPIHHGVRDNSGFVLSAQHETLAEAFSRAGYETAAFVGAFVLDSRFGLAQGFRHYDDDLADQDRLSAPQMQIAERSAEEVLNRAIGWFSRLRPGTPFFGWIHLFDPHAPYQPPGGRPAGYESEVAYVDSALGAFLDRLRQQDRYQNTLIVVTSDHGEGLGEHGEDTHGMFLYDSTLRVPLLIKLPQGTHGARVIPQQVRLIDVVPTVLRIADLPAIEAVQGVPLIRFWTGEDEVDLPAYSEALLPLLNYGWSDLYALRTGSWKWIRAPRSELYKLDDDPAERLNLFAGEQAMAARLDEELTGLTLRYSSSAANESARLADPETRQRLQSLGYAALSLPVQPGSDPIQELKATLPAPLADPKGKIGLFNSVWQAQELATQGRHREAVAQLEEVIRADPRIFMAHSIRALSLLELNLPGAALGSLETAAELRPEDPAARLYLGLTLLRMDRLQPAVTELEKALQLDPEMRAARNNLGAVYGRLNQFADAARIFRQMLEEEPNDVAARMNLGVALMMQQKSEEALTTFLDVLKVNEAIPELHNNLGILYLELGSVDRSIRHLQRAVDLKPSYANAHYNLARALEAGNRPGEAAQHRRRAAQLGQVQ